MKKIERIIAIGCILLAGCSDNSGTQGASVNGAKGERHSELVSQARAASEPSSQAASAVSLIAPSSRSNDLVLAQLPNGPLMQSQLDQTIALRLYDLEWSKYELRRQALAGLVETSMQTLPTAAQAPVEILIQPPIPPRVNLGEIDDQPVVGDASAPVIVSVFCNYQSSHCARMLSVYESLLALYPQEVKLAFFDLPLAFHREARIAAQAARCAHELGDFWPYHKGLFAQYDKLASHPYSRLAKQLEISESDFSECMASELYGEKVEGNLQLAGRLDLDKVPITLINGLYLGGPKTVDTLRFFVDMELERVAKYPFQTVKQGNDLLSVAAEALEDTALPLRLEGVLLGEPAANSVATIFDESSSDSRRFRIGDEVLTNVTLAQINQDSVVINNEGIMERLRLSACSFSLAGDTEMELDASFSVGETSMAMRTAEDGRSAAGKSLVEPDDVPAGLEYTYRGVVDAVGETPLSKAWIQKQLGDADQLLSHFAPTELEVEGVRVLRLDDVGASEFYQTLGLQEKDVILRVNNEWVHEAQNNLFDHLQSAPEVSIVLMRKGLPVHLKYAIN